MTFAIIFCIFALLLILGTPLFIAIGVLTGLCLQFIGKFPLTVLAQQMFGATENSALLAIPFFVIASTLMTAGSSAKRIVEFIRTLIDWIPGGLAITTTLACVFFAALSGLSPTTIIAVGSMMYPALKEARYPEKFSLGLVTSAGSIGILVPPSIVVIIFAIIGGVSIGQLFIAGIIPITLICGVFIIYSVWIGLKEKTERTKFSIRTVGTKFYTGFWALLLPFGILYGIYTGKVTVNEAAAFAAVYAFIIEIFFFREIKVKQIPELLKESASMIGMIMIIVAVTLGFNWFVTIQRVPQMLTDFLVAHISTKIGFLIMVNFLLLFLGCIMDILSAVLITVPLLLPVAQTMGINPVHFGIIFIVNFELGYLTPPVGINLFTSTAVFKKPLFEIARASLPFIILIAIVLCAITYFPQISLFLLNSSGIK